MRAWCLSLVLLSSLAGPAPAVARSTISLVEASAASQPEPSSESTVSTGKAASPGIAVTVNINRNDSTGAATTEYSVPSASSNNLAALTTRLEGLLKRVRPAVLPQPPPQLPRYLVEERGAPPQYGDLSELTDGLRGAVAELDKTHEGVAELLRRPPQPSTGDLDTAATAAAVAAGAAAAAAVAADNNLTGVHVRLDEMNRRLRRLDQLRHRPAPLPEETADNNNNNAAGETLGGISRDLDGLRAAAANLTGTQGDLTDLAAEIASETRDISAYLRTHLPDPTGDVHARGLTQQDLHHALSLVNHSRQAAAQPAGAIGYEALSAVTDSLSQLKAEGVVSGQQRVAEADGLARISNISTSEIMAELGEVQRQIAALRASEQANKRTPPLVTTPSSRGATVQELREMISPVSREVREQRQQAINMARSVVRVRVRVRVRVGVGVRVRVLTLTPYP